MASQKLIEDALNKKVNDDAVNAIVRNLDRQFSGAVNATSTNVRCASASSPSPQNVPMSTNTSGAIQAQSQPALIMTSGNMPTSSPRPVIMNHSGNVLSLQTGGTNVPRANGVIPAQQIVRTTYPSGQQQTIQYTSASPQFLNALRGRTPVTMTTTAGMQNVVAQRSPGIRTAGTPVMVSQPQFIRQSPASTVQPNQILVRTSTGQLQVMRVVAQPQAAAATASQLHYRPITSGATRVQVAQPQPPQQATPQVVQSQQQQANQQQQQQQSSHMTPETAKMKCKNFLATLLRLANDQPPNVARNVCSLIQGLIDGDVTAEDFTTKLQRELNSSPQPCLVPFLKKSLPHLRESLAKRELVIEGVTPPSLTALQRIQPQPLQTQFVTQARPGLITQQQLLTGRPPQAVIQGRAAVPPRGIATTALPLTSQQQLRHPGVRYHPVVTSGPGTVNQNPVLATGAKSFPPRSPIVAFRTPPGGSITTATKSGHQTLNGMSLPPPRPIVPGGSSLVTTSVLKTTPVRSVPTIPSVPSQKAGVSRAPSSALKSSSGSKKGSAANLLKDSSGQLREPPPPSDEDINDVAAMGGVNLQEESQRILGSTDFIGAQTRSCKDETFFDPVSLTRRIGSVCRRYGLSEPSTNSEVVQMVSHSVQERLKNLLESVSVVSDHRLTLLRFDEAQEMTCDVRCQLRFLEEVEKVERKRQEEAEREMLLKAAKSRSKVEDPEHAKLKAKAKELQRAEMEEMRQREANLTALKAIGPRKKPRLELENGGSSLMMPGSSGTGVGGGPSSLGGSGPPGGPGGGLKPRIKRVNLRDLLFVLENERTASKSTHLYQMYGK